MCTSALRFYLISLACHSFSLQLSVLLCAYLFLSSLIKFLWRACISFELHWCSYTLMCWSYCYCTHTVFVWLPLASVWVWWCFLVWLDSIISSRRQALHWSSEMCIDFLWFESIPWNCVVCLYISLGHIDVHCVPPTNFIGFLHVQRLPLNFVGVQSTFDNFVWSPFILYFVKWVPLMLLVFMCFVYDIDLNMFSLRCSSFGFERHRFS